MIVKPLDVSNQVSEMELVNVMSKPTLRVAVTGELRWPTVSVNVPWGMANEYTLAATGPLAGFKASANVLYVDAVPGVPPAMPEPKRLEDAATVVDAAVTSSMTCEGGGRQG